MLQSGRLEEPDLNYMHKILGGFVVMSPTPTKPKCLPLAKENFNIGSQQFRSNYDFQLQSVYRSLQYRIFRNHDRYFSK